jgi:hypothetical protein
MQDCFKIFPLEKPARNIKSIIGLGKTHQPIQNGFQEFQNQKNKNPVSGLAHLEDNLTVGIIFRGFRLE